MGRSIAITMPRTSSVNIYTRNAATPTCGVSTGVPACSSGTRRSATGRNLEAARHRGASQERIERAPDIPEIVEADQRTRVVESDQVAHPRERRDVGDRV